MIQDGADGKYAGTTDRRRKAIGLEIKLSGNLSDKYTESYAAQFKKKGKWHEGADGSAVGTMGRKGPAICKLRVTVRPVG